VVKDTNSGLAFSNLLLAFPIEICSKLSWQKQYAKVMIK
jgi:hypothetical protein